MSAPRGRPFEAANTMGRGRPKGSRNKAKLPGQQLLDQYSELVTRKCLAMALHGDVRAMRICMERLIPTCRASGVPLNLPRIRNVEDIDKAAEAVTRAVSRGKITAVEASILMNMLESRSRVMEKVDLEKRIEGLEQNLAANRPDLAQGQAIHLVTPNWRDKAS